MQGLEWIILILAAAFLLFGGSQIPKIPKALGRAKGEYTKARKEFNEELEDLIQEDDELESKKRRKKGKKSKVYNAAKELGISTKGRA